MSAIDQIAMYIGYAVMAAGGIAIASIALFFANIVLGIRWVQIRNSIDLKAAVREWKRAHPEKWQAARKRNRRDES